MIPVLGQSFESLERKKEVVLAEVADLTAEQLSFRPGAGEWSVMEVLDHLAKVERALMDRVRRELPEGNPVTMRDRLGARMVILVMRSRMRVKVPGTAKAVLPEEPASLTEVEERWSKEREEMGALLGGLRTEQLECGLFRHAVGGWMTIAEGLEFLAVHMRHHDAQLRRLKRGASARYGRSEKRAW